VAWRELKTTKSFAIWHQGSLLSSWFSSSSRAGSGASPLLERLAVLHTASNEWPVQGGGLTDVGARGPTCLRDGRRS
jgi:hypothetical protein